MDDLFILVLCICQKYFFQNIIILNLRKKLFNDKRICLCDDFEVDEVQFVGLGEIMEGFGYEFWEQ